MNTRGLGKDQRHLMDFGKRIGGNWHTYAKDIDTVRVVKSLESRGILETNKFSMLRFKIDFLNRQ